MANEIAIVGCGPAGIISAIGLARRNIPSIVFEASDSPMKAPSYNPDRSYAIDITGHGLRAISYIDARDDFDRQMIPFDGIDAGGGELHKWNEPGWIGSRGDIMRVLMKIVSDKYADLVTFCFNARVTDIDVAAGDLTCEVAGDDGTLETLAKTYDLVIAADGGGSTIRNSAETQCPEFFLTRDEVSYYCKMIALDRAVGTMDEKYLSILSLKHPCVAGAISGPGGPSDPIWFCQVPFSSNKNFADIDEARSFLKKNSPAILELASAESIESFSKVASQNIGRSTAISQCYAGKVIFIGDACASYPPIGQGANAAMESAIVLDQSIEAICPNGEFTNDNLLQIAKHYNEQWHEEVRALSWAAKKMLLTKKWHLARVRIGALLNRNVLEETKSSQLSYVEVRERANRVWPLWAI